MNYACVLILNTRQTYGIRGKKLLYKAFSYIGNKTFLVPYQVKYEFSKKQKDKYILLVQPTTDNDNATIMETIGEVEDIHAYCIYMYYATCNKNGIYDFASLSIPSPTPPLAASINQLAFAGYDDKLVFPTSFQGTPKFVFTGDAFTIDNQGTLYHDDAISITKEPEYITVHVYITHICNLLNDDTHWEILKRRVCSVYLPHHRKDLLPKNILERGNLKKGETHSCIVVSFRKKVGESSSDILLISDRIEDVYISKNYIYEEADLINDESYQLLKEMSPPSCQLSSRQIIAYWSIQTNSYFAKKYRGDCPFIYTTVSGTPSSPLNGLQDKKDDGMHKYTYEPTEYIQISSPLRRYIDLYNQWVYIHRGELPSPEKQPHITDLNIHVGNIRKLENTTKLIAHFYQEWNTGQKDKWSSSTLMRTGESVNDTGIEREGEVAFCEYDERKKKFNIAIYILRERFYAYAKTDTALDVGRNVRCKFFVFEHAHHFRNQKLKCCIILPSQTTAN